MNPVDKRLSEVADEIVFWQSEIVAEPHRADRILDRLQIHLRERDHLLSLSDAERSRVAELWPLIDAADEGKQAADGDQFRRYVAQVREYSAILNVPR